MPVAIGNWSIFAVSQYSTKVSFTFFKQKIEFKHALYRIEMKFTKTLHCAKCPNKTHRRERTLSTRSTRTTHTQSVWTINGRKRSVKTVSPRLTTWRRSARLSASRRRRHSSNWTRPGFGRDQPFLHARRPERGRMSLSTVSKRPAFWPVQKRRKAVRKSSSRRDSHARL